MGSFVNSCFFCSFESSPQQLTPSNSNVQLANGVSTHLRDPREYGGVPNNSFDVAGSQSTKVVSNQPTESTGLLANGSAANASSNNLQANPGSGGIASGDIEHVLFGRALLPTDTMVSIRVLTKHRRSSLIYNVKSSFKF